MYNQDVIQQIELSRLRPFQDHPFAVREAWQKKRQRDAVFAVVIASSLFNHNRELSEITQNAYFSILNGEKITNVRFRYDRETDEYWKKHMWDD